jgi:hypothetical protein
MELTSTAATRLAAALSLIAARMQETIAGLAQRIMRPGPGVTSGQIACPASH